MQEEVLGRMGTSIGGISTLMLWRETFNLLSMMMASGEVGCYVLRPYSVHTIGSQALALI